jgi:hypothetical protein
MTSSITLEAAGNRARAAVANQARAPRVQVVNPAKDGDTLTAEITMNMVITMAYEEREIRRLKVYYSKIL